MTEVPYTIGFLGGFSEYRSNSEFIDNALDHYCVRNARLRVLVSPTTESETRLATRILAARKRRPKIEVVSVIATAHLRSYQRSGTSWTVKHRNRIIAASDYHIVVPDTIIRKYNEQLYDLFIAQCDLVLYNGYGRNKTDPFLLYARQLGIPIPIAFLPTYTAAATDAEQLLDASLAYVRANAFRVQAEKLPQVFLRRWNSQSEHEHYARFSCPEDAAAVFRLNNDNIRIKVFAYALAVHTKFWSDPESFDEKYVHLFYRIFCRQLERITRARASGQSPGEFELFDFNAQLKDAQCKSWAVVRT